MITRLLNLMLAKNPEIVARLQPFLQRCVALNIGVQFCWQICDPGRLVSTQKKADAKIEISLSALPLLLANWSSFKRTIHISGDEKVGLIFAQMLSQLGWEIEEAISSLVGDVIAVRLIHTVKQIFTLPSRQWMPILQSLAAYYQYETEDIINPQLLEKFYQGVDLLRDDTDRLEQRIGLLLQEKVILNARLVKLNP